MLLLGVTVIALFTRGVVSAQKLRLKHDEQRYMAIAFTDSKRKPTHNLPPPILDIRRVTSVKMLGITITNHLSVAR